MRLEAKLNMSNYYDDISRNVLFVLLVVDRTNVSVQIDVLLRKTSDDTHASGAFLASNVNIAGCWTMYANGLYLWVSADTQRARLTGNHSQ